MDETCACCRERPQFSSPSPRPYPDLVERHQVGESWFFACCPRRPEVMSSCYRAGGSSPPGSSRRAGGYSPVLRLTADEMSLPLFPCPKKFTFWDTTLLPRGTFWVRVPRRPARGRPKAVFLLLACCTQEEDAGPAKGAPASVPVTPNYGNPRSRKCP